MLRVGDLDRAIAFYQKVSGFYYSNREGCSFITSNLTFFPCLCLISKAVGMKLLRKKDNPEDKVT